MSYEMNAEGLNGVKDTTTIVALPNWDPGTPQFPGATLLLVNGNGTNISANAVVGTGNLFGCGVQRFAGQGVTGVPGAGASVVGLAADAPR